MVSESSITSNPEIQIYKFKNVNNGDKIWSNKDDRIGKLPGFLEEATLFQLPNQKIEMGTQFKITTPPSSVIYIAYKENSGWESNEWALLEWQEKTNETVVVKRGAKSMTSSLSPNLSKIWYKERTKETHTNILPKITLEETFAAIFVVEGKT